MRIFFRYFLSLLFILSCASSLFSMPFFLQDWFIPETFELRIPTSKNEFSNSEIALLSRNCKNVKYRNGYNLILIIDEKSPAGIPQWFVSQGMTVDATKDKWLRALSDSEIFTVHESWKAYEKVRGKSSVSVVEFYPVLYGVWKENPTVQLSVTFTPDNKFHLFSLEWRNDEIIVDPVARYEAQKDTIRWAKLPHVEKYACAFSSNLLNINKLTIDQFNPKVWDGDNKSMDILKNSWGIESRDDLLWHLQDLSQGGQAGSFNKLRSLFVDYPAMDCMAIACKQGLTVLETNRLFFVEAMAPRLGEQGLLAWDEGRSLNLIRWSLAAGYITHQEALELAAPYVEKIESSYSSWEDYMSHYIIGRGFMGLNENTYGTLQREALDSAQSVDNFMCVSVLPMKGKATNTNPVLSFTDTAYIPSDEAIEWEPVMAVNAKENPTEKDLETARSLVERYPNHAGIGLMYLEMLYMQQKYQKAYTFQAEYEANIKKLPATSRIWEDFYVIQMILSFHFGNLDKVLESYSGLPLQLQQNGTFLYFRGMAYANKIGTSPDYEVNRQYAMEALSALVGAEESGFELPEGIKEWIQQITGVVYD